MMLIFFVILLATGEFGPARNPLSWAETPGGSDGPLTKHKKVRCYSENVKVGDDRNYKMKIRKDIRKWLGEMLVLWSWLCTGSCPDYLTQLTPWSRANSRSIGQEIPCP
jgi:hypothetical protein